MEENFADYSKALPNYHTKNGLTLNFKAVSDRHIYMSGHLKNLKFLPKRSKSTFQRLSAHF